MKIAVFTVHSMSYSPATNAKIFSMTELEQCEMNQWDAILIIGSNLIDEETTLSTHTLVNLWEYVNRGGVLYTELIEAFDFSSSRLLGWKQDFAKTRRTVEKLRVSLEGEQLTKGALLEWSGAVAHGFPINTEAILDFGLFQDTHISLDEQASVYPGLHFHEIGAGRVAYAAFSLFSNEKPETLRPYSLWENVILTLSQKTGIPFVIWSKVIETSGSTIPREAVVNNISWFLNSGILPALDGGEGVYENIHSITTKLSKDLRPDCHAHTALMLYLYGKWQQDDNYLESSDRMLQYLFDHGYQDLELESPSYGFFKWYDNPGEYPDQMFTDDNAWVCFVLLYLYRQTNNESYLEHALPLAEALLATQNKDGLRPEVLKREQLIEFGREGAKKLPENKNPHFQSITHAAFIQTYLVTQRKEFLDVAMKGSLYLLKQWDELEFMYSRTSGLSRFLLPLGFLSRYDDSGEIDQGIERIVDYLLSCQSPLGGIEETDNPDPERFGKEDAGVFIHNGEGIADQLYTNNFLLMNVWELWKSNGDNVHRELYDSLSDYMCRIQMISQESRYSGGWMRAYDLRNGEYFGNNGDTGWGPYCMESGWTNAITTSGLLLGLLNESIFE
ncbi:hypothetical protein ACP8HI_07945 [Paenibacillus sp. FA6]|uniref:hypothetical protein n=1 Tax=Paenibacillus sp. FA6 TaxID=3413029 RepID=UPI003F65A0FF